MTGGKRISRFFDSGRSIPPRHGIASTGCRPEGYASANIQNRSICLRDGLQLQAIKAEYREDLEAKWLRPPGFGIYLQFEDSDGLDLSFEGHPLPVGRHRQVEQRPFGYAVWRGKPVMFHRQGAKGTRLCAVMVWLTLEWIDQTYGSRDAAIPPGSREHLAISRWFPSHRVARLARSLFEPDTRSSTVARLRYEIIALELVSEALATMRAPATGQVRRSETLLLNKACDVIATELAGDLSIGALARELGVGARTLGRLFQQAYGCSVTDYIRTRRLDAARNMLEEGEAISAAAAFAGYASKTNFSTAFRRQFGITPGRARDGDA